MKIQILNTFLDGRDRFEKDDVLTVQPTDTETSEQRGARFVAAGWAKDLAGQVATGEPATGEAALDIHNSTLGVTSTTKG
jgi:hypothetical protein